jgi:hypothetical protein
MVTAVLDDARVAQFQREGWLSVRALLGEEWLDRLRAACDAYSPTLSSRHRTTRR